jgi:hypothetical protein
VHTGRRSNLRAGPWVLGGTVAVWDFAGRAISDVDRHTVHQAGTGTVGGRLVGRFHGSNLMPIKIGSPGWRCDTMTNEKLRMTADTIDFLESVV